MHFWPNMHIWALQIWSSGVSLKNLAKCSSDALFLCQQNPPVKSYDQIKFLADFLKNVLSRRQSIKRERENTRIPLFTKLIEQPQSQPTHLPLQIGLKIALLDQRHWTSNSAVHAPSDPRNSKLQSGQLGSKLPLCESFGQNLEDGTIPSRRGGGIIHVKRCWGQFSPRIKLSRSTSLVICYKHWLLQSSMD